MFQCGRNLLKNYGVMQKHFQGALLQSRSVTSPTIDKLLENHDHQQISLLQEPCLLVNDKDECIGVASKKDCHLLDNIHQGMLHRAFSVFLFNSKNELLLQQRSEAKITFPLHYTNTCCSHPLAYELEKDEKLAMGVKRAAQRKLFHELGITPDQIPLNMFQYITRIQYMSENRPQDGIFGENEIDYVLIIQKDVDVSINLNEVKCAEYVSQEELKHILDKADNNEILITPWFKLICDNFLFKWWNGLKNLKEFQDHKTIYRF
ncbi:ATP-dependent DNA helicase Q4 [Mactra antiquata]